MLDRPGGGRRYARALAKFANKHRLDKDMCDRTRSFAGATMNWVRTGSSMADVRWFLRDAQRLRYDESMMPNPHTKNSGWSSNCRPRTVSGWKLSAANANLWRAPAERGNSIATYDEKLSGVW